MGHSRVEITVGHLQSDAPPLVRQKTQNFKNISQDDEDNKHTLWKMRAPKIVHPHCIHSRRNETERIRKTP